MKHLLIRIIVFAVTLSPLADSFGQSLVIKGSDTLLGLSQKWAEAYKAQHPEAAFQVAGGGAAAAFAALAEKQVDIVLVSRLLRFKEAEVWVKHKTPVLMLKTDNEIPKDESAAPRRRSE